MATISALSKKEKKQTRSIADSEVNKLAPGLAVKHAGTADSAASASTLVGLPPSAFVSANTLKTSGLVKFSSGTQTLVSNGPLSITATCVPSGILVDANTTEAGTVMFHGDSGGIAVVTPGTPAQMIGTSVTDETDYSVVAPSGASITGYVAASGETIAGLVHCSVLAYGIG